jgi:hypothetical protein
MKAAAGGFLAVVCIALALSCDYDELDGVPAGFADGVDNQVYFEGTGGDLGVEDFAARSDHSHGAADVSYDNTTSGLAATDVQAAIDEINAAHELRIAALEAKLASVTATTVRGYPAVVFSGVNVYVDSGAGATDAAPNGTGNLIVGYNELRGTGNVRAGSHNVIVGRRNNYSSYGGLVVGHQNAIAARYASVVGGYNNTASGEYATVTAGIGNTASGAAAGVSGGYGNTASGHRASVSGGYSNTADGDYTSVSGGNYNTASGADSHVCGGLSNTASADYSNVP